MKHVLKILICLLALLLPCTALAEFADARGKAISAEAPQRVVCLYGSYAEAWLDAGGTLVGVTEDAVTERGMSADEVSVIGTTMEPNLELILSLDPDFVICNSEVSAQLDACEVLEAAGIPCAALRMKSYTEYADAMRLFTSVSGHPELYDALIPPVLAEIEACMTAAQAQESPAVLLLRAYSSGVKVKDSGDMAGGMLKDMHCDNIADRIPSLLEELTLETIVAEDPEYIFVVLMGSNEQAAQDALNAQLADNPAWAGMTAVQNDRVIILPRALFHYKPNLRWAESYRYLADILYN